MQDPLRYHVFVNGSARGSKTIEFAPDDSGVTVTTSLSIRIDALFFTLYRYQQTGWERWEDGKLSAFEYVTRDNGTESRVSVYRGPDGFIVNGPGVQNQEIAAAAAPSFWNYDIIKSDQIINPQTGALVPFSAVPLTASSTVISGTTIEGLGYAIDGFIQGELWFDHNQRSLALRFLMNGYQVDAVRVP